MGMEILRTKKIIVGLGILIGTIVVIIGSISLFCGVKAKKKLSKEVKQFNEFNEFTASSYAKRLRKLIDRNKNIGIFNIKEEGKLSISPCLSYQHANELFKCSELFLYGNDENKEKLLEGYTIDDIMTKSYNVVFLPYLMSVEKLNIFWKKYKPDILTKFGLVLIRGASEFNFIDKIISLLQEMSRNEGEFGYITIEIKDNSVNVLSKIHKIADMITNAEFLYEKTEKISLKSKNTTDFVIFLLSKANIFDLNNIYDTLTKISSDTLLKGFLLDILENFLGILFIPDIDKLVSRYIPATEETKKMISEFLQEFRKEENDLKWILNEFERFSWVFARKLLNIYLENKEDVMEWINEPENAIESFNKFFNEIERLDISSQILRQIKIFIFETEKNTTIKLLKLFKVLLENINEKNIQINTMNNNQDFKTFVKFFKSKFIGIFLENEEMIEYLKNIVVMLENFSSDDDLLFKMHIKLRDEMCLSLFKVILTILYD
ncbi:hypothetical protein CWI39_0606p0010 [Hamiltosporidium magnivora]|uniref:Uncharacterized protein n=2 Tax=Hamiltosporidium TaxID=1176354 RepID=A0A4Q9LEG8_9MICR|nr:hypothetical protein CWI39_0606p0010 [Hamiltosporidium magnivora]